MTSVLSGSWAFGISEVTTWPWTFAWDVERYPALGATSIELWEFKLAKNRAEMRRQIEMVHDQGMTVSSFQAEIHTLFPTHERAGPAELGARTQSLLQTLETIAPLIPGAVFVLNTGIAAGGDVGAAFEAVVDACTGLAQRACDLGVRLAIEPLHPLAMNADSFIWNLEDALAIADAVGSPGFGICADSWNLAGQFDIEARLARCRGRIFLAQVSDFRRPRSFLDRVAVGDGTIDFPAFLRGLTASGYAGPLVLEIFSKNVADSLYDGDLDAVIEQSRNALANATI